VIGSKLGTQFYLVGFAHNSRLTTHQTHKGFDFELRDKDK